MVEDPEVSEDGSPVPVSEANKARGPRVAFQIVPKDQTVPPQSDGLRQGLAFVLSLVLVAACAQVGQGGGMRVGWWGEMHRRGGGVGGEKRGGHRGGGTVWLGGWQPVRRWARGG